MAKLIRYECPNCGALIKDPTRKESVCEYCGSIIYINQSSYPQKNRGTASRSRSFDWNIEDNRKMWESADLSYLEKSQWNKWEKTVYLWGFLSWIIFFLFIAILNLTLKIKSIRDNIVSFALFLFLLSFFIGPIILLYKRPEDTYSYKPNSIFSRYSYIPTFFILLGFFFAVGYLLIFIIRILGLSF